MHFVDNAQLKQQMAYLDTPGLADGQWQAAEVILAEPETDNAVWAGAKLVQLLPGVDGAVLVESPSRFFVFAAAGASFQPLQELVKCEIAHTDATARHIANVADSLKNAARPGQRGRVPSTLMRCRAARKKNILMVADDDALICATMKNALQRYGECLILHKVQDILEPYLKSSPDCVFLDLHLEGGSGMDVLDAILAHDSDAHIAMLTSDSTASQAAAAKARGVKSFISKPVVLSRVEYELSQCPTFRKYAA